MDYIGEHLLPGQLGHFFIVLSLVASLVATFAYFKSTISKQGIDAGYWKKLARYAFITEAISVIAIFGILFYIISNNLFEYKYAWQHSSRSLEGKYLLACFWEGQEGSFLLWSFWHCVLGLILIKTSKQWEAPVMTVVSFAQLCLATMIAGIYFFGEKLGSNPFILLRDSGVLDNAPALHINMDINQALRPDYMSSIKDGNDLNPLLQNYWMVIHPPVLFMGFASTLIPFAFVIAGLWTKKFGDVLRPALPWSLFSLAVLGVGIMMGAAWAYESLTFGGYWAWDPVENASLVPWLILIAGVHTVLIYKHSGHSLRSAYLFLFLTFIFILYSTFLTRSGILGEASVHAFTDLGMNGQLYLLLYAFTWVPAFLVSTTSNQRIVTGAAGIALLLASYFSAVPAIAFITIIIGLGFIIYQIQKQVPTITKEESGNSREFWMFIGALVFFLSAIVIISKTSLPVINKVFNVKLAAPEDEEMAYNQIQIFVAIIIGVLTAITQYLKYKNTDGKYFWKKIGLPTAIAVVLATLILVFGNINYDKHGAGYLGAIWLAVACSVYAIIANAAYILLGVKGKLKLVLALLLLLSAIVIIGKTLLIGIKNIFGIKFPAIDEITYNQVQIFASFLVVLLTIILQYLKHKNTGKPILKKAGWPILISVILATTLFLLGNINYENHDTGYISILWITTACAVYAVVANILYLWVGLEKKLKLIGGSISHVGFGLVLLGILISSSKKEVISRNTSGIAIDFGTESKEKTGENLTLIKGLPMKMGKFDVAYLGDSAHPKKQQWYYTIHFKSRTDDEEFTLRPNAFVNYKGNEGLMANPDSRHYWDHDVFTYISALPNPEKNQDTASFRSNIVKIGDSIFYSKGYLVLEKIATKDNMPFEGFQPGDKATVASLKVHSFNKTSYTSEPLLISQKGNSFAMPDTVMSESLIVRINSVNEDGTGADIGVKESSAILEYVTLKAYKFPFINVLWAGIIITAIGIIISMVRRIQVNRLRAES